MEIESFKKRKIKYVNDTIISNKDIENYKILYNLFMEEIYNINFGEMEYFSNYLKDEENNKNIFKMLFIFNKNNTDIDLKKLFEKFLNDFKETYNDDYMKY